jgi:N-formylmaleamate deformylase
MTSNWLEKEIEINGICLHTLHVPASGKASLVLVHGFSDNGWCWQETAEALAGRYELWMPDMRGHGLSARVQSDTTFDMVTDLVGLIQTLSLKRPIVAGHSMGAAIAFQLGARYPELPRALVLEDPPWFDEIPPQHKPEKEGESSPFSRWVENLQFQTLEQLLVECHLEHPTWSDMTKQRWCEGKKQLDPNFLSTDSIPRVDWRVSLKSIICPTLLITADPELGGLVTPDMASQAVQINPQVKVAHIPGVGHHVRFGNPALYRQNLEAFFQTL